MINAYTSELSTTQIPLPIETAYFLNDSIKQIRDPNKFNRFYFNYPAEWKTSNTGEMIVGERSIWTTQKKRFFKFYITVRKYLKMSFFRAAKQYFPELFGEMTFNTFFNTVIDDDMIQQIIDKMDSSKVIIKEFEVITHIQTNESLYDLFDKIQVCLKKQIDFKNFLKYSYYCDRGDTDTAAMIEAINTTPFEILLQRYNLLYWFVQKDSNEIYYEFEDRDVQVDGYYEDGTFNATFFSPRNSSFEDDYFVDMLLTSNPHSTYYKLYEFDRHYYEPDDIKVLPTFELHHGKNRLEPSIPFDDSDKFNDDFNIVFNVGDLPHQNHLDYFTRFHRKLVFKNVYDRSTVKIHASFANQSNNYYVGNSHVYFTPIKYYKLNAKDNVFWIDFYYSRYPTCPVNLPDDDGFVLEMLFMQNKKLLYV